MSESFSERLARLIKESGKKQSEIAAAVGIAAPYLSDLKKGKKGNPSSEVSKALAECLGVPLAVLLAGGESQRSVQTSGDERSEYEKRRDETLRKARERDQKLLEGAASVIADRLLEIQSVLETMVLRDEKGRDFQINLGKGLFEDFNAWVADYRAKEREKSILNP